MPTAGSSSNPWGGDEEKLKAEIWKLEIEMEEGKSRGRLSAEFRERTKLFAARIIRLYVSLPKERE